MKTASKYLVILFLGSILGAAIPASVAHPPCSAMAPQKNCHWQLKVDPYDLKTKSVYVCD